MHRVFVYGTLKEGFPNFKSNNGTRYQGKFTTLETYPLYLVGDRYSPWLILDSTKTFRNEKAPAFLLGVRKQS
ncbi:gamma-glutamylcyclotransferase [Vibrio owensii]|uniref:gamma-glutamylcyclotransferase n=1 Tax=Vibrio owensii TaxID=696485 RepID=UPI000584F119|nr:gamma-glutamylcyclotransferase [Vibrio owensii]